MATLGKFRKDGKQPEDLGQAEVVDSRPLALRVRLEKNGRTFWVPKSCIHDDSEVFSLKNGKGKLVVMRWFAIKELGLKVDEEEVDEEKGEYREG